jgi:hypothetical protein
MKKLTSRLFYLWVRPEPWLTIEHIAAYGDEISSMTSHCGDLYVATRRGSIYRVRF